jgi:hypothetical protein
LFRAYARGTPTSAASAQVSEHTCRLVQNARRKLPSAITCRYHSPVKPCGSKVLYQIAPTDPISRRMMGTPRYSR